MIMKQKNISKLVFRRILVFLIPVLCFSCTSQKKIQELNRQYLYFQNIDNVKNVAVLKERVIQAGDLITIQVLSNSLNQEQTMIFNLTGTNTNASSNITNNATSVVIPSYIVNAVGDIEMPVIGQLKAVGSTKAQLEAVILDKLSAYVKNPIVLIRFSDFKVNVLGEVKTPGSISFQKDKVTIIDALSTAGDLTDYGKREDITVLREENGTVKNYKVDIRDVALFKSPAYQLKPNDIVYVGGNNKKMKALQYSTYNQKGVQTFLGVVTITAALIYLVTAIIRNN
jgi:polysaccharide biosynthesis/export protein